MFYYQNHFLFTTYIPRLTNASETTYQTLSLSHSARKNADKRAPKIGFENPYIVTDETGLYFSRIPQIEYATEEIKAM